MSIKEAAQEVGVTPERMRELCRKYGVGQQIGRTWVITREELDRFLELERSVGRPRKDER